MIWKLYMTTHKPLRHKARHVLPEFRIQHPDHGRVAYRWMGHQDALDFNWGDIRTAVNNHSTLSPCGPPKATRILEKQNRLQMSQVFPFRASMIKWPLLFKDSMSGTEERVKLLDSHTNCKCTDRSKNQALPASLEELPGLLPLTNFGPA